MTWDDLRQHYPRNWLLVEAHNAFDQGAQRIIPHLELIAAFGDDRNAGWERYKSLHHADKLREYYLLHTDRETLDIGLIDPFFRIVTA